MLASGLMPPGFPFSAGFRVLFERASFDHRAVFEDGPPKSSFTIFNGKAQGTPVPVAKGCADPALLDVERAIEALMLSVATQSALAD